MIILESIKLALKAVWAHKIRSFLTMLGILIGISSVVLLVSLGEGVKEDIKGMIGDLGSNFIFVVAGDVGMDTSATEQSGQNPGGLKSSFGNPANLFATDIFKKEDLEEIEKISGVEYVSPMGIISGLMKYDDKITSPMIISANPEMQYIWSGLSIEQGRFINDGDINNEHKVIIIGETPKQNLFGDEDAIGKKIKIAGSNVEEEFEVIGIFAQPTITSAFSGDMNTITLIPYTTGKQIFNDGEEQIFRIAIKANDRVDVKEVSQKIQQNMLQRHEKEEFTVMNQEDMLSMLDDILTMMTAFIAAIAAISLVVGGVGIMNIMLVSVTERTREIGLRKAVGATNGAILFQFLTEAIILSVLGGLISLLMVAVGVEAIKYYSDITPVITTGSVVLSMGVCIGIGLVFGIAPAVQASRKDPIESLRYE